jgi:RHS repeat-associated protein
VAQFAYDALDRRVQRTINGVSTQYVYDGIQAVAQIRNGQRTHLLTGLMVDELIASYAQTESANEARIMLSDALGSVLAETREDQTIATRHHYTPYGQVQSSGEASINDTQYTGRENDGTGLYFYRARYYDPVMKRFTQSDPIGLMGGINMYGYVGGDPISYVDPAGQSPATLIGACVFVVGGVYYVWAQNELVKCVKECSVCTNHQFKDDPDYACKPPRDEEGRTGPQHSCRMQCASKAQDWKPPSPSRR